VEIDPLKGLVSTRHAANLLGFASPAELLDVLRADGLEIGGYTGYVETRAARRLAMRLAATTNSPRRKEQLRRALERLADS
jgi:hypothetical protein